VERKGEGKGWEREGRGEEGKGEREWRERGRKGPVKSVRVRLVRPWRYIKYRIFTVTAERQIWANFRRFSTAVG